MPCRRGHFALESGLHADTWLALDRLLVDPCALRPRIEALAEQLKPHRPTAICGPLLGGAFIAQSIAITMGLRFFPTERVDAVAPVKRLFAATYRLPEGLLPLVAGERCAVVDDAISAGSSVRATAIALTEAGATIAVVGALMVLGERAIDYFASARIPLVAGHFAPFESWLPDACPLCIAGVPLSRFEAMERSVIPPPPHGTAPSGASGEEGGEARWPVPDSP